jgi:hypothetical protein
MLEAPPSDDLLAPAHRLRDLCAPHLGCAIGGIRSLCAPKPVADDPGKWLLSDVRGRPVAVVKCAAPAAPDLVEREAGVAREIRAALGPRLGAPVVEVIATGRVSGLSYMLIPYHRPFSRHRVVSSIQRRFLRSELFEWLRLTVAATASPVSDAEKRLDFEAPLQEIANDSGLSAAVRDAASDALRRLLSAEWSPKCCFYHNDLWSENILFTSGSRAVRERYRFTIIDWAGARLRGHAMYDLVRLSQSMNLSREALRDEVRAHCRSLRCHESFATAHLLAALGHLGAHLEAFPRARYLASVERYFGLLQSVLAK